TSLKWLCGTPGAGVLHVATNLARQCQPELRGWFSQPNPFSWDLDRFEFAPDARRFDHGTPGIMANVASLPALEWHARQDMGALLAHNRALTGMLIEAVDELGLTLATPRAEHQRGGSIMVTLPKTTPAAGLLQQLKSDAVFADARSQTLRLSPGVLTTQAGVEKLLQSLRLATIPK
ncbi:MAG: aminotransferase class V-fold PLP-dependent enzyme, partial [Rhodobacteraceae bacterium]|nr:aminotransferase class V-fold PLP-dependent enzyme [Paracoccaceae bacterium]